MNEENLVAETRQRVIAMILEARLRIESANEIAQEVRAQEEELGPTRSQAALDEITSEARKRVTELVRDARHGVRGGWGVGVGGIGTPTQPWDQGLSPRGLAARDAMLGYIGSAKSVFVVDLAALETGEAPSAEAAAERDAAAAEVAAYEDAHPAPEGVSSARDRLPTTR